MLTMGRSWWSAGSILAWIATETSPAPPADGNVPPTRAAAMLGDPEWTVPPVVAREARALVAARPRLGERMGPSRGLVAELDAYGVYCRYRSRLTRAAGPGRTRRLAARRRRLRARIQARRL